MLQLTDFNSYKAYFEGLAVSHVDIKESVFGDTEVLLNKVKAGFQTPFIFIERYKPPIILDQNSDNYLSSKIFSVVVYTTPSSEKFSDQDAAYSTCESIALDLISKLLKDYNEGLIVCSFKNFKYGEVEPPMGGNKYVGCRLELNYSNPEGLAYNPAKWQ